MFFRGIGVLNFFPWNLKDSSEFQHLQMRKANSSQKFWAFNLWHQSDSLEEMSQAHG